MQLKKLEMCGFKSFANRTEIAFEPGVTCIVGPNGCGKSNVVDAIKWVLGTLSYKSIRGDEMLDVIFKGAEGVAPMGFAEVSLTLDNSDKTLAIEFEEVTLTRRMYRSGEGEYYINRSPCRLKDIRELLYGTGIGTDNYSIIEQGKIDKLVLSNTHERRLVFDEAAGISKYRAKKRETEHRLEKVTNDLLRMTDIIREVQRELRSIRAQAGRAQRYKELAGELDAKRARYVRHEYAGLKKRSDEISRRIAALEERRAGLEATLGERRGELERIATRSAELDSRVSTLASERAAAESKAGYLQQSIETSEKRLAELTEERARLESDLADHRRKIANLEGILEEQERELQAYATEIERLRAEAEEAQEHLDDANRECSRVSGDLDARKAEALELAHKESQYRTDRNQAEADLLGLVARKTRVEARQGAIEKEWTDAKAKSEELLSQKAALEGEISELMARKTAEDQALSELKSRLAEIERDLQQLRENRERRVAQRETLRALEMQFEGLDSGVKELLRSGFPGVRGTVADFLEVRPECLPFVEAALGERAGSVVCEDLASATAAVEHVKGRKLGRTSVVALNLCHNGDEIPSLPGIVGRVSDFVRSEPEALAHGLLGRVLLVENSETALAMLSSGAVGLPLVTREGDLFEPKGLLSTGPRAGSGLLSRKSELRRLEAEIEDVGALIARREAKKAETESMIRTADEKLEMLRQLIYEKNLALHEAATQGDQVRARAQFLDGEVEAARIEIQEIALQTAALEERRASVVRLLVELEGLKAQVAGEIVGLGMTLARYEESREQLKDRLTVAKVECAKVQEKQEAQEKRIEMVRANLRESRQGSQKAQELLSETAGRFESVVQDIARQRAEREGLAAEIESKRAAIQALETEQGSVATLEEEAQRATDGIEAELVNCQGEAQDLRVEEGEDRVRLENLITRAREEYHVELEGAADAVEEVVDWEALGREIEELRVKVANFGQVNVYALDQLNDLESREKNLLVQQEDLTKTKDQLEEMIRKLNRESKALFEQTLAFVREHFNTIFRKLFGGGKADLVVEGQEGVDPMEQGLEIMARPPGKELTAISLLSGGEKSLTALALVMALFKANPSPFCLLDEADAALDEKNVEKYAGMVSEFVEETQFVVITHNKRTMAVADVMYGVTMEQRGVSKKVMVDLNGDAGLDILRESKIKARQARQSHPKVAPAAEGDTATAVLDEPIPEAPAAEIPAPPAEPPAPEIPPEAPPTA